MQVTQNKPYLSAVVTSAEVKHFFFLLHVMDVLKIDSPPVAPLEHQSNFFFYKDNGNPSLYIVIFILHTILNPFNMFCYSVVLCHYIQNEQVAL